MTSGAFLQQFDAMANAPNGVQKLRELILQLAMRGKLVPQDTKDEPASTVLDALATEKERLFSLGKINKPKSWLPMANETPFDSPAGWEWSRLGVLGELIRGVSYSKSEASDSPTAGYIGLLRGNNIADGLLNFDGLVYVKPERIKNEQYIRIGDTLIAMSSGSKNLVGKAALARTRQDRAFGAFCGVFRQYVEDFGPYLRWFFQSNLYRANVSRSSQGIGINNLRSSDVAEVPVSLPPLAEQHRIVTKIDELMALCDRLEARQQRRTEARLRLNRSALHHLTIATSDAEFGAHWRRVRENFHLLYDTPETVAELRQAVLQLAVRGKLVPQDSSDEPASVLLLRIAAEKARLFDEGKIGKAKALALISEGELPFEVPDGWLWVRWAEVASKVQYGYTASADSGIQNVRLLRITDIQNGRVDWDTVPGCVIAKADVPGYRLCEGDLLIARTGGTIGKSYLVPRPSVTSVFASYLIRIAPASEMSPQYFLTFAGSPLYWEQLLARSAGTGQPNVNGTALSELLFPLPPFAQQVRIVAKVSELMALCDTLEGQLTRAREKSAHLAASAVHHLTAAESAEPMMLVSFNNRPDVAVAFDASLVLSADANTQSTT